MTSSTDNERLYSQQEVSIQCGLAPYILRYWEIHFPELGRSSGKAGYTANDIALIWRIKKLLYTEHLTIEQAKARLSEERAFPVRYGVSGAAADNGAHIASEVKVIASEETVKEAGTTETRVAQQSAEVESTQQIVLFGESTEVQESTDTLKEEPCESTAEVAGEQIEVSHETAVASTEDACEAAEQDIGAAVEPDTLVQSVLSEVRAELQNARDEIERVNEQLTAARAREAAALEELAREKLLREQATAKFSRELEAARAGRVAGDEEKRICEVKTQELAEKNARLEAQLANLLEGLKAIREEAVSNTKN